jgi:hypothetical protein
MKNYFICADIKKEIAHLVGDFLFVKVSLSDVENPRDWRKQV